MGASEALPHIALLASTLLVLGCVVYFSLPVSKPPDLDLSALISELLGGPDVNPWGLIRCVYKSSEPLIE